MNGWSQKSENSLLWVVGRVSKYTWVNSTPDTVMTCNNNPIFHGVNKIIVKEVSPDSLDELTPAVSHELASLGVPSWVPAGDPTLERIGKLRSL